MYDKTFRTWHSEKKITERFPNKNRPIDSVYPDCNRSLGNCRFNCVGKCLQIPLSCLNALLSTLQCDEKIITKQHAEHNVVLIRNYLIEMN